MLAAAAPFAGARSRNWVFRTIVTAESGVS